MGLKISDFGWKCVFSSKIHEKGVFFKRGYERGIHFGRGWGAGPYKNDKSSLRSMNSGTHEGQLQQYMVYKYRSCLQSSWIPNLRDSFRISSIINCTYRYIAGDLYKLTVRDCFFIRWFSLLHVQSTVTRTTWFMHFLSMLCVIGYKFLKCRNNQIRLFNTFWQSSSGEMIFFVVAHNCNGLWFSESANWFYWIML